MASTEGLGKRPSDTSCSSTGGRGSSGNHSTWATWLHGHGPMGPSTTEAPGTSWASNHTGGSDTLSWLLPPMPGADTCLVQAT